MNTPERNPSRACRRMIRKNKEIPPRFPMFATIERNSKNY